MCRANCTSFRLSIILIIIFVIKRLFSLQTSILSYYVNQSHQFCPNALGHEPSLQLNQLYSHLTGHLSIKLGFRSLILGVPAMVCTRHRKPCRTISCLWTCRDLPPGREQRSIRLCLRRRQGVPFLILTPHHLPSPSGPKQKLLPFRNVPLVTLKPAPTVKIAIPHCVWPYGVSD